MLIQSAPGQTSFIGTGTSGYILQTNGFTATWVTTATLVTGRANESNLEWVSTLTTTEITPDRVLTMVVGAGGYVGLGASSLLKYNTNNQLLTAPLIRVSSNTSATSTTTGALQVVGGVGVGGNLYVGGEIVAQKLTIQYTTITSISTVIDDITSIVNTTESTSTTSGALIVSGGVGISKNLYVGGIIYGRTDGLSSLAYSLSAGTAGQVPYQSAPSTTSFFGPGTVGQLLVSNGTTAGGPLYTSTSSIMVGYAGSLLGGGTGSLPYQSAANVTAMLPIGAPASVLSSNGSAPSWIPLSGLSITSAVTATNLANGTLGQVPFQTAPGLTNFYGPGVPGQLLVSAGTGSGGPVYTNTSSITVGHAASLTGGATGSIPYQSGAGTTAMIPIGLNGYVLTSNGTTATWAVAGSGGIAASATTATHIAGGTIGAIPYQNAVGRTTFLTLPILPGSQGQIVVSGINAPVYTSTITVTTLSVGSAWYGGAAGEIRAANEITAYYTSDKRLKENIKPIENALEKIRTLHGVMFDWTDSVVAERGGEDGYFVRKHDTGIIAQEVEAVLPEVVVDRDNGFKAVRYEKLAGLIIQAINELADQVDELKKKIQ
jgi:hypothetical protein